MYLKTNSDNFVSVLQASGDYFAKNDYEFYPRANNPTKYDTMAIRYSILIILASSGLESLRQNGGFFLESHPIAGWKLPK